MDQSQIESIEKLCNCGNTYGNCNHKLNDCPAFQKYRELIEIKFNDKYERKLTKLHC